MSWDVGSFGASDSMVPEGHDEAIELVGTHLRMTGRVSTGRFHRLSDLVNHSLGYVRVRDARLLRRNGEPTNLQLAELLVNQDEISFIGQTGAEAMAAGTGGDASERPAIQKESRRVVLFTPGHTVSGTIYVHQGVDIAGFVDASDPRFVPLTDVKTRSLADRRIIGHYVFALVNRTHMLAASEVEPEGEIGV